MTEIWKPVVGFEGLYEVSDLGRVRSIKRRQGARPGRVLRPTKTGLGLYETVVFHVGDGQRYVRKVHRLVLEAFIGPCPDGLEGCHKDDDPANNRLDNLFWGTHADNCAKFTGIGNPAAKFSDEDVRSVFELRGTGLTHKAIAAETGMSRQHVGQLLRGERRTGAGG